MKKERLAIIICDKGVNEGVEEEERNERKGGKDSDGRRIRAG